MRRYFIPHESNNFHPHFFREGSLVALTLIIITLSLFSLVQRVVIERSDLVSAVISAVLVDLANEDRQLSQLPTLTVNPALTAAAQAKAEDMAANGYFAHFSPTGISPWQWLEWSGYRFSHAGENLAIDFSDSADVNRAWMASPLHRANILSDNFTEIGIATARGIYQDRETTFVVQMFGRPALPTKVAAAPAVVPTTPPVVETEDDYFIAFRDESVLPAPAVLSASESYSSSWQFLIASPGRWLLSAFIALGALILVASVLMVFIEIRKQHPKHVIYALSLTVLMLVIFYGQRVLLAAGVLIK